jgi:hypothetical protein
VNHDIDKLLDFLGRRITRWNLLAWARLTLFGIIAMSALVCAIGSIWKLV